MERLIDSKILYKDYDSQKKTAALFLDRDGVLIKDKHYISDPKDVQLEDGAIELLKLAKRKGLVTIIITNQSGIGRGYFSWSDYDIVTKKMLSEISSNNLISAIFANSIVSSDLKNSWRKPGYGMIYESIKYFNINLRKSILIGDRISDLQSGVNASVANLVHVSTGHGISERKNILKYIKNGFFYHNKKKSSIRLVDNLHSLLASNFLDL